MRQAIDMRAYETNTILLIPQAFTENITGTNGVRRIRAMEDLIL
jgi:hypothetical protein